MIFEGQKNLPGFPDDLIKVVNFLNEKTAAGGFGFSDSISFWENNESIIEPLGLGHVGRGYYFAVGLAYIAKLKNGKISFSKKDKIRRWAWAFHLISGIASWPPEFMKRLIRSFEGMKEGIEGLMNWAVKVYGSAYYDYAVTLMSLLPQYRMHLLSGLINNDFERFCTDYPPTENTEEFANVFVMANPVKEEDCNKAFDIAIAFSSFTSATAMAFFLSIRERISEQRAEKCEQIIIGLLQGDTSPYVAPICNWLFAQQKTTPLIDNIIQLLITGLVDNKEVALRRIDDSINLYYKDPVQLTKLFVAVAETLHPTDILTMDECLHNLSENKEFFRNLVLAFVIHPKGEFRIVGRRLWDDYHLESSDFDPQKDLDEKQQCLFTISMLQDFGNPETRLPKLLPLIDSDSEHVRNILMSQLLPYLDDYMGHVINVLDKLNIKNKYVIIIKRYYKKRGDAIEKRRKMKELSPRYRYTAEFQETLRLQKVYLQGKMREAEKGHKNALKDLMKHVVLARGGSWRDENGKIQHLACIKFSVPRRQLEQSMTPMEREDWINELLMDWNDTTGNN